MGETAKELIPAVMTDDRLGNHRPKPRHALADWPSQPAPAMMKWQIGTSPPVDPQSPPERMRNLLYQTCSTLATEAGLIPRSDAAALRNAGRDGKTKHVPRDDLPSRGFWFVY